MNSKTVTEHTLKIKEERGNLNFGVQWISLDGRLNSSWFPTLEAALKQRDWLRELWKNPTRISLILLLDDEDIINKETNEVMELSK
ncbi:MAG: hypothetical protein WC444_05635 [Candidatus Paceibacterota bacterium]